jgi:hypothetical protein
MDKFCYACSVPLSMPEFKGPAENYCTFCTDDKGNLRSKEEVKMGIVGWFKTWQPGLTDEKAAVRAASFMKAMPAWAD